MYYSYRQVDDYDFDNENDVSEFCPNAGALSEGNDAEYPLDNAGIISFITYVFDNSWYKIVRIHRVLFTVHNFYS